MQVKRSISIILICIFAIINFQSYIYAKNAEGATASSNPSTLKPEIDTKNMLITNIPFETTVEQFKEKISGKITSILNAKKEDITKNKEAILTTGTIVTIDKKEYAVIVTGDLDGDGIYTYKDVLIEEDYLKKGSTDRKNVTEIEQYGSYDSSIVNVSQHAKLTLFVKTDANHNTYQNQNFSITDIGTSNQRIWYGCNSQADGHNFVVRVYKGATRNNPGTKIKEITFKGGGHQIFKVSKTSNSYHIYTGAFAPASAGDERCPPKGVALTTYPLNLSGKTFYNLVGPSRKKAIKLVRSGGTRRVFALGVDELSGKMVTCVSDGGGAQIYKLNTSNLSASKKEKKFRVGSAREPYQGGCLVGKYYYMIEGRRRHRKFTYILL